MANPALAKLKLFYRVDFSGRIVVNSGILRAKRPRTGRWIESPATQCCNTEPAPPVTLESLTLEASETDVTVGDNISFTITANYSDGTTTDVSSTATIESSDEEVVSTDGEALTEGTADITATVSGVTSGPITITVTAA